ncbi:hypothetical protein SH501x_002221 [Pirellulaceae bacterium SH501]
MTHYSKPPTTLDQLVPSKARLDNLAQKQGLLANWKQVLARAVASDIPTRGVSKGQ